MRTGFALWIAGQHLGSPPERKKKNKQKEKGIKLYIEYNHPNQKEKVNFINYYQYKAILPYKRKGKQKTII